MSSPLYFPKRQKYIAGGLMSYGTGVADADQ
jgi:hypothetical protein